MKRPVRIVVMLLAIIVTAGVSMAYAQSAANIDVPFAFNVGLTVYQAGKYEVRPNDDQTMLTIVPAKGKEIEAVVITRLGEPDPPLSEGRAVFDKVAGVNYLSEIWLPGSDGYLVHATPGEHTHVKVKLTRKG